MMARPILYNLTCHNQTELAQVTDVASCWNVEIFPSRSRPRCTAWSGRAGRRTGPASNPHYRTGVLQHPLCAQATGWRPKSPSGVPVAVARGSLVILLTSCSLDLDGPLAKWGASPAGRLSAGPVKRADGVSQIVHLDLLPIQLIFRSAEARAALWRHLLNLHIVAHNYFIFKEIKADAVNC